MILFENLKHTSMMDGNVCSGGESDEDRIIPGFLPSPWELVFLANRPYS